MNRNNVVRVIAATLAGQLWGRATSLLSRRAA